MVTYNHRPFIAQAIEGVLQQKTNFPFELVIGEDCSTDGTREIVDEYQKKYPNIIRVVTSEKNVGMKKNGLRTVQACRGKYLAFCDGDDYWQSPLKLQKQADYLESHPECGLVYSSYDVYHVSSGERIKDYINYRGWKIPEDPGIADIVEGMGKPLTCTVMVRWDLCEEIVEADPYLHKSDHFLMGDTQLWVEIAAKARLHYIPESLATHTITEESATRSKDIKRELRFSISNAELMLYLCKKYNLPTRIRDRFETYFETCSLQLAFHTQNRKLADEVRNQKGTFTLKEWIRYYGARNILVHDIYRASVSFLGLFRKKHSQWT